VLAQIGGISIASTNGSTSLNVSSSSSSSSSYTTRSGKRIFSKLRTYVKKSLSIQNSREFHKKYLGDDDINVGFEVIMCTVF
jgi:hypothetical protein